MNRLFAAAFLISSLQAQAMAAAADEEEDPAPAAAEAAANAVEAAAKASAGGEAPAAPQLNGMNYGSFAIGSNGQQLTGDALQNLPPEARWAMSQGLSPVLGPNNEVLGYDVSPMESRLTSAVAGDYAKLAQQAQLPPGAQGPCPPYFPNCHSQEPVQPPPATETAADVASMIPAEPGKNHCDQPGPPPPCAPPKETPEERAERERQEADQNVAAATEKNDEDGLAEAIERRNKAQNDAPMTAYGFGQDSGFGTRGTRDADNGPGPTPVAMSGGRDQSLGPAGRIGGDTAGNKGNGLTGRQVTPDARDEARSILAMRRGMENGPPEGPLDPNVQSVARTAQVLENTNEFGSSTLSRVKRLLSDYGIMAAGPGDDQTATIAAPVYDNGVNTLEEMPVVECTGDTLGGTSGNRKTRRVGRC